MPRDPESLKILRWASQNAGNRQAIPATLSPDGWDSLRSLPTAAGGEDLVRRNWNQLLLELTSAWAEVNERGIPEWSNAVDFRRFAPVTHGAGTYIAEVATGPGTGNATTPGTDAAVWRPLGEEPASAAALDHALHLSIFKNVK